MTSHPGHSLRTYLLTRIALAVPTVLILLTMVFLLMRVAPGNPIQAALGGHVPQAEIQAREHRAGYDRPILTQYLEYLSDACDPQPRRPRSPTTPVTTIMMDNGAATLELTVAAFFVAVVVGVSIGLAAGRWRDTLGGRGRPHCSGSSSTPAPVFFPGFLLQLLFADLLGWLPRRAGEADDGHRQLDKTPTCPHRLSSTATQRARRCPPAPDPPGRDPGPLTSGVLIRLVSVNLMQTMKGDYVEAARARGVGERRVVIHHAFRNALVPVVTVAGLQFALLLGGAILTEETFNWPGIGSELVRYLNDRDYIAVQGIITVSRSRWWSSRC